MEYKKGMIIKGTVIGIEPYGAFVSLEDSYTGLIHISEISYGFVKNIADFVQLNQIIFVEVLEVKENLQQIKLSIKNIAYLTNGKRKKHKIIETKSGFSTLLGQLPIWIKSYQKEINERKTIIK